jgi:hypothetical protein
MIQFNVYFKNQMNLFKKFNQRILIIRKINLNYSKNACIINIYLIVLVYLLIHLIHYLKQKNKKIQLRNLYFIILLFFR